MVVDTVDGQVREEEIVRVPSYGSDTLDTWRTTNDDGDDILDFGDDDVHIAPL